MRHLRQLRLVRINVAPIQTQPLLGIFVVKAFYSFFQVQKKEIYLVEGGG